MEDILGVIKPPVAAGHRGQLELEDLVHPPQYLCIEPRTIRHYITHFESNVLNTSLAVLKTFNKLINQLLWFAVHK